MSGSSHRSAARRAGYVLLEAIGALVVFSVGIIGVQRALREVVVTRAQARDYTQARFLLDDLVSEVMMRPTLTEGTSEGDYPDDLSRFHWRCTVSRIELPVPEPVVTYDRGVPVPIVREPPVKYMGRIEATVSWTLRGQKYSQTTQTLCQPEKLPEVKQETEQTSNGRPGRTRR